MLNRSTNTKRGRLFKLKKKQKKEKRNRGRKIIRRQCLRNNHKHRYFRRKKILVNSNTTVHRDCIFYGNFSGSGAATWRAASFGSFFVHLTLANISASSLFFKIHNMPTSARIPKMPARKPCINIPKKVCRLKITAKIFNPKNAMAPPTNEAANISKIFFKEPFAGNHPKIIRNENESRIKFTRLPKNIPKGIARTRISLISERSNTFLIDSATNPSCASASKNQNAATRQKKPEIIFIIKGRQDSSSA